MNEKLFTYDNSDYLIILKSDNIQSDEVILQDSIYSYCKYNVQLDKMVPSDTLDVVHFDNGIMYDGEAKILDTPKDRLKYIYASYHNDAIVDEMVKKVFPVNNIDVPSIRCTQKPYVKHWLEKYNITLEDLWKNNKYIIVCSHKFNNEFRKMMDLGMFDWDKIEDCSVFEEDV